MIFGSSKSSGPNDLLDHERRARRMNVEFFRRFVGAGKWRELPACVGCWRRRSGLALHFPRQNKRHQFIFANPRAPVRNISLVPDNAVLEFQTRPALRSRKRSGLSAVMNSGKIQRPVIERARQAKSVVDQHRFARTIAFVHSADLRNGGVRFIDHESEKSFGKKSMHRVRLRTGRDVRLRCRE